MIQLKVVEMPTNWVVAVVRTPSQVEMASTRFGAKVDVMFSEEAMDRTHLSVAVDETL